MARTITYGNGKTFTVDLDDTHWLGNDGYYFNNLFRTSNKEDVELAIEYMLQNGWKDSSSVSLSDLQTYLDNRAALQNYLKENNRKGPDSEMAEIIADAETYLKNNNMLSVIDPQSVNTPEVTPEEAAFNAYYRDIMSTDPGTLGGDIYNNFVGIAQNQAMNDMALADAQLQQSSMQQAATVKAITDELRAERMEKLRAGMSEAQIANQDMQQLMTNVNTLNQNVADMNLARMQAMQQYDSAQDTAYQAWLENIQTLGQTGSAYSASDAGDLYQQALRIQNKTKKQFIDSLDHTRGSKIQ